MTVCSSRYENSLNNTARSVTGPHSTSSSLGVGREGTQIQEEGQEQKFPAPCVQTRAQGQCFAMGQHSSHGSWIFQFLPINCCVTLNELLNFSEPLLTKDVKTPRLREVEFQSLNL